VRALKIVDFPTLGRPTIPQFNGIVCWFLVSRRTSNRIVHWRIAGMARLGREVSASVEDGAVGSRRELADFV
jgi:hypothetical protein